MAEFSTFNARESTALMDMHVGLRLRLLRSLNGVTQAQLAGAIGVTAQMVHKYESGLARISPGRLHASAAYFHLPISVFFEHFDAEDSVLRAGLGARRRRVRDAATLQKQADNAVAA